MPFPRPIACWLRSRSVTPQSAQPHPPIGKWIRRNNRKVIMQALKTKDVFKVLWQSNLAIVAIIVSGIYRNKTLNSKIELICFSLQCRISITDDLALVLLSSLFDQPLTGVGWLANVASPQFRVDSASPNVQISKFGSSTWCFGSNIYSHTCPLGREMS